MVGMAGFAVAAVSAGLTVPGMAVAGWVAAVCYPAVALGYVIVRRHDLIRRQWRRRVLAAGLTGATWLTLAGWGMSAEQVALLLTADYALAASWWRAIRIPHRPRRTTAAATAEDDRDPVQRDWDTFVGASGKVLAGSRLAAPEPVHGGHGYPLHLSRGQQTVASAVAALPQIATGLDIPMVDLIAEPHPTSEKPSLARLVVLSNNPIRGDVRFDGPRLRGDDIALGPLANGQGEAVYHLYTPGRWEDDEWMPGSMWSGFVAGDTGTGKSRLIENLACSVLHRGDTVVWFIDGNNGSSSPAIRDNCDWYVGQDGAEQMLQALLRILEIRTHYNSRNDLTGFTPSPAMPGLLVVIEECHKVFTKERGLDWASIAREGRKAGLALLTASQYADLQVFAGVDPLRSSILAGNGIALRTKSHEMKNFFSNINIDLTQMPAIPGYAMVDDNGEGHAAPFRNRLIVGPKKWLAAQPRTGLDRLTQTAAGQTYAQRGVGNEQIKAESDRILNAVMEGDLSVLANGTGHVTPTRTHRDGASHLGTIIAFPAPLTPDTEPAVEAAELSESHQKVLEAVAAGATTRKQVTEATGLGESRTTTLLRELVEAGHLTQPAHGKYTITTAA